MLYHLFQYLESAGVDFPGIGLMNYLSFRAMLAAVTAVLVSMLAGKHIIRWLQKQQIGETVRDLGLSFFCCNKIIFLNYIFLFS